MSKLALFDFDGTISRGDSQSKFMRYAVSKPKFIFGVIFSLHILIRYFLKMISNDKVKVYFLALFFRGMKIEEFDRLAKSYSINEVNKHIFTDAQKKLAEHKRNGDDIVIVSASLENWLRPWCEENGFDLIATQIEVADGLITGKLASGNCYGEQKVKRIKELYNLDEYEYIYAYGNSRGDREMLELADESFYRVFKR